MRFNVGVVRKAIEGQADDVPILVLDPDGLEFAVASMAAYEGCDGTPAISLQLEEEEEEEVDDDEEEDDEDEEEDDEQDEEDEKGDEPIDAIETVIPVHRNHLTDDY